MTQVAPRPRLRGSGGNFTARVAAAAPRARESRGGCREPLGVSSLLVELRSVRSAFPQRVSMTPASGPRQTRRHRLPCVSLLRGPQTKMQTMDCLPGKEGLRGRWCPAGLGGAGEARSPWSCVRGHLADGSHPCLRVTLTHVPARDPEVTGLGASPPLNASTQTWRVSKRACIFASFYAHQRPGARRFVPERPSSPCRRHRLRSGQSRLPAFPAAQRPGVAGGEEGVQAARGPGLAPPGARVLCPLLAVPPPVETGRSREAAAAQ